MPPKEIPTAAPWHTRFSRATHEIWISITEEWLGWIAIALFSISCSGLVFGGMQYMYPNEYIAQSSELGAKMLRVVLSPNFIGTLWVLVGTLWALLGVFIPANQVRLLQEWEAQRTIPPAVVLRALRVASNFGKSGSVFVLLGSTILLSEMLFAAVR